MSPEGMGLAPINKLPPEILLHIFILTAHEDTRMLDYLPLTSVCRYWRALALDAGTLWTKIDLGCLNYSLVQEILSRSKLAKLDVDLIYDNSSNFNDVNFGICMLEDLIGPQFGRLNSLSLQVSSPRWRQLREVLEQEAPSLKHLTLANTTKEIYSSSPGTALDIFSKPGQIPKLFNGVASLETLVFNMPQSPPWTVLIPLMGHLRELTLVSTPWDSIGPGFSPQGDLLDAIRGCPSLELLDIGTIQEINDQSIILEPIKSRRAVELPNLSRLVLRSTHDATLLHHLIVPCLKQLYIALDEELSEALVTAITEHFDMGIIREMTIGTGCAFLGTSERLAVSDWSHHVQGNLPREIHVLSITCCCREIDATVLIPFLVASAKNATQLILREGPQSQPCSTAWRPLEICNAALTKENNVSDLVIAFQGDSRPILRMLAEPSICPALETLTCVGGFQNELYVGSQIKECLKHRSIGVSSRIRKINMRHCPSVDEYCAKEIKKLNVEVSEDLTDEEVSHLNSLHACA